MIAYEMLHRHGLALADAGVSIEPVQDSLKSWREFVDRHGTGVTPSLDPMLRYDVRRDNSLHLKAMIGDHLAGVIALRAFETESLHNLCRSGRLWWPVDQAMQRDNVVDLSQIPDWSGRMIYQGGLRVIENGRGISWHLIRMIRWVGYSYFEAQYSVGCMIGKFVRGAQPIVYNGYEFCHPVMTADIGEGFDDVYVVGVSREASETQADLETAAIRDTSQRRADRPAHR